MDIDPNTVLGLSFGAWAAVVGLGTRAILQRLDKAFDKIEEEAEKFNQHVFQTEQRLIRVESKLFNNGAGRT